jgi:MFS transporter, PPP family, 3-phenylpropionic acid transporter
MRAWLGFAGFYAASFAVLGVYMQYFPGWLRSSKGLLEGEVSLVLAAQTTARSLLGIWWAQRVDRAADARRFVIALSLASVLAMALIGVAPGLWWTAVAALLFGGVFSPMYPITDAAALQTAHASGFSFGRVRVVGSISYLATILAVGAALDRAGDELVLPLLLVGIAAMAACAFGLPRGAARAVAAPGAEWWTLLRHRPVVLLLVAAALIQGSHATFYNLSTMHWHDHGISKTVAGALWAEGIVAEIALFLLAPWTADRCRPTTLLMIGGGAAIVRWTVVGTTTSVPWLCATSWLHALTFGCTYLGSLRALDRRVPPEQRVTAQGLLGAATSGVGMVVGGVAGGFVYQRWEGFAFLTMAAFAAPGLVLAWRLRRQADNASTQPTSSAPSSPA